jgi:glycosyltransferase involved in cell wall biosynthesis
MNKPLVSVIISTQNRKILLRKAVESVLRQSFKDWEIIIIDDNSQDGTEQFLRETFLKEIQQGILRYARNESKCERSFSRNRGIDLSCGEYIAILDDDDCWLDNYLETMVNFLKTNRDTGVVFSNYFDVDEQAGRRIVNRGLKTGKGMFYRKLCLTRGMISGSVYLFRKEVFLKIGGFIVGIEPCEDREFFSRVAMNFNIGYSAVPAVEKLTHRGSFARQLSEAKLAEIKEKTWQMIQANSVKFNYSLNRRITCNWYIHLSMSFLPDLINAKKYMAAAVKIYPVSLFFLSLWSILIRVIMGKRVYWWLKKIKNKQ